MAFPTSPTNGQIYKGRIYNSITNCWDIDRGEGTFHSVKRSGVDFDGQLMTYATPMLFDASSLVPVGTKRLLLRLWVSHLVTLGQYYYIEGYPTGGSVPYNNAVGNHETIAGSHDHYTYPVMLGSDRKFYLRYDHQTNVNAVQIYATLTGYWI